MSKPALTGTLKAGTAVDVSNVTKTFEQWQRTGQGRNILKNLLKPEKRVVTALDDVTFKVEKGEFVAYAGPNGAGKSTTMKLLCGMLQPASGDISVLGMSPRKQRIALMKRIGVLFGNRTELWWDHPVASSFEWKRVVWNIPKEQFKKARDMAVELLGISDIMSTFARELSFGQRMRADLAMLLLHDPELILLDEPTLGLDVLAKRRMISFLKQLNRDRGTTIMVTSHDMDDLEEMARRIMLISEGRLAFDGDFDRLRKASGSLCRVSLAMHDETVPGLSCGRLVTQGNGIYEFEVDTDKIPVKAVLSEIAGLEGISDVEFKKAPIEQVIAEIYSKWKGQS